MMARTGSRRWTSRVHLVLLVAVLGISALATQAHAVVADLSGRRVAVLIGDGFHDGETVFPMGYLVNRGARITVIGSRMGVLQAYNSPLRMMVTHGIDQVSPQHFDALILPGGLGPAALRRDPRVVDFVRRFVETGKPVAAICHGPQVLITAGVMRGRRSSGIGGIKEELEAAGATYVDAELVVDGNVITSRLPGDLPAFSRGIAEALLRR